ncbi:hypothetical protein AGMMS50225_26310 [Betaproteobacteria bacterium]|nr:hypothetical protein AGMMS50225_26310 [Betaproteobacteria bacterium]
MALTPNAASICGLRDIVGGLVADYETMQHPLPEVGSQGVVSEILTGKRELNVRQIQALSERFGVSPATFI